MEDHWRIGLSGAGGEDFVDSVVLIINLSHGTLFANYENRGIYHLFYEILQFWSGLPLLQIALGLFLMHSKCP